MTSIRCSVIGGRDGIGAPRRAVRAKRALAWPEALLPWAVAESICAEAGRYLGVDVPRRRAEWLTRKAEICFQRNAKFRKKMRSPGEGSLQYLRMFMRHWLASMLKLERPDLFQRLPDDYVLGRALPAGKAPRLPRAKRLYRSRGWKTARVVQHPRWAFLAPVPSEAWREYPII